MPQLSGFDGVFFYATKYSPFNYTGQPITVASVTDGLSNTAAVAEILVGDLSWHQRRTNWNTARSLGAREQLDAFTNECSTLVGVPGSGLPLERGTPWLCGETGKTFYNHVLGPNSNSCLNGNAVQFGAYSAASEHVGGANVLFADGHVVFASTNIDLSVWREFGSRSRRFLDE